MFDPFIPALILAQACSGPYCAPDSEFERPAAGVFGSAAAPSVTLASDGGFLVAWEFRAGGEADVLVNRREPGAAGRWLDAPVRLDRDAWGAARSIEPRIAAGPGGLVVAAWQDARDGADDLRTSRSTDGGRTWAETEGRAGGGAPGAFVQSMPALAVDGAGRAWLAWEDQRDGGRDVYVARSPDGGASWGAELRADADPAGASPSYHPQLAAWEDGTVLVCWWDESAGYSDLLVRRSTDAGASWEGPPRRLDPGDPGAAVSRDARIAVRGATVAIAWEEGSAGDVVLRVSPDRGATWGPAHPGGPGGDPVLAALDGSAVWAWRPPPARSGEKTSLGGRIVEIPRPVAQPVAFAGGAVRTLPALEGPSALWLGRGGDRVYAARGGTGGGRGAVLVHWAPVPPAGAPAPAAWQPAATLLFGAHLLATSVDVSALSLAGAASEDGELHLVWVARWGEADELGYCRLRR